MARNARLSPSGLSLRQRKESSGFVGQILYDESSYPKGIARGSQSFEAFFVKDRKRLHRLHTDKKGATGGGF
ncbi:MAG: hypothetical protein ACFN4U_03405 [Candidatus Absconditicoccaceae bacterium]